MNSEKLFKIQDSDSGDYYLKLDISDMPAIVDYYHTYNIWEYVSQNFKIFKDDKELVGKDLDNFAFALYDWVVDDKNCADENDLQEMCNQYGYTIEDKKKDNTLSNRTITYSDEKIDYLREQMNKNNGLILLTGATGSGKTTLGYSLLNDQKNKKIYTIEDPIEEYFDNFIQLQVNEDTGFDYANGIKQILRHEPDIIYIGEICDEKTAKMAVFAANTGRLVLATMHATSFQNAIDKMIDYGVDKNELNNVLLCSTNQRLFHDEMSNKYLADVSILDNSNNELFKNTNIDSILDEINSISKDNNQHNTHTINNIKENTYDK